MLITKNGNLCIIDKEHDEQTDNYLDRCWFIINKVSDSNLKMKEIIRLSRCWSANKIHGCVYSDEVMKEIIP